MLQIRSILQKNRHAVTQIVLRQGKSAAAAVTASKTTEATSKLNIPIFMTVRNFGITSHNRFAKMHAVDDDEDDISSGDPPRRVFSATDMEFYDEIAGGNYDDGDDDGNDFDGDSKEERKQKKEEQRRAQIRKELDMKTGRPWTNSFDITQEDWMSTTTMDDLPEWSENHVSRISSDRVQLYPGGIPTLSELAKLPLPPPPYSVPGEGQAKAYAKYRKRKQYKYIYEKVKEIAHPKIGAISKLPTWEEKQNAVDKLFETTEVELAKNEDILSRHPKFGLWVEKALEAFLRVSQSPKNDDNVPSSSSSATAADDGGDDESNNVVVTSDDHAMPIFMDCYDAKDDNGDKVVPTILSPLKESQSDMSGRMVEEWELAAHKATKRILLRQCTRAIAQQLESNDSARIFVTGRKGVGKTAVLASIVASARKSDNIVMYLPDGDRLRKNGYFITPNALRDGFYDLQDLSQEVCADFLASHEADLQGMDATKETMEKYFKDSQLKRITDYSGDSMSLIDLLKYAQERKIHAPICFLVVVDTLMNQSEKPFLMVLDEFNCYFDQGHYFHVTYDENVRNSIPCDQINLFEHAINAMAISTSEDEDDDKDPITMKRGAIIVGMTESRAVPRKITESLTACAQRHASKDGTATVPLFIHEVPRFSDLEVDHILANFEATGVGKLRLDRGEVLMNPQEVAYMKMVTGNVGQYLVDASMI